MEHKRYTLILACALSLPMWSSAQFAVNPQLGLTFQNLTEEPEGTETKAAVGGMLGLDFRLGKRLYFQPGAYFCRSSTYVKQADVDTVTIEDNLIRSSLKLKALVGYNLIDGTAFRLRGNIGPTYDVLVSIDDKDDEIDFNQDNYNSGSFNFDAGLGADISIITLETGISYGLTNAFKEQDGFSSDAKFFIFYFTLGVVLGGSTD